jgi:hypothetical protein
VLIRSWSSAWLRGSLSSFFSISSASSLNCVSSMSLLPPVKMSAIPP